jgi:hypothetical protein
MASTALVCRRLGRVTEAVQQRGLAPPHCPGRKLPFFDVKRPARPYKSAIQNFKSDYCGKRLGCLTAPGGAGPSGTNPAAGSPAAGCVAGRHAPAGGTNLGFGRVVVSEIEAPNLFVDMV